MIWLRVAEERERKETEYRNERETKKKEKKKWKKITEGIMLIAKYKFPQIFLILICYFD